MDFRIFYIGETGVLAVPAALVLRNLREGAYDGSDRFRVELTEPALASELSSDELLGFFALLDPDLRSLHPGSLHHFLGDLSAATASPLVREQLGPGGHVPAMTAAADFDQSPLDARSPAGGQGSAATPSPTGAGAAASAQAGGAAFGSRPMLWALAALLALGAILVWPRDRGERTPESVDSAAPPPIAVTEPAAREVIEARFARLDAIAYVDADVASAQLRALRRGERVDAVASGGEDPAPEGWVRLQNGGYVTATSLATAAPPALQQSLNQEVALPAQTGLFGSPSLSGRPVRTLAQGQALRVIGLVTDEVAEVRIGQELGYIAYAALFAATPAPAPAPAPVPDPRAPPLPQPRGPVAREATPPSQRQPPPLAQGPSAQRGDTRGGDPRGGPPNGSQGPIVLGLDDLSRQPSAALMQRYYPPRALRDGLGASVAFSCRVTTGGRLTACTVYRETGRGAGFTDATIRLAQDALQVAPRTQDGRSTDGAQFNATITWRAE